MPEGWRQSPTHHRKGIRKLYKIGYRAQQWSLISASYANLKSYTPENGIFSILPVLGICGATFGLICLHINWGPLLMGNLTQKSSKFATLSDTKGSYQTTDVSELCHLAFFASMLIFWLIMTNYIPCWMDSLNIRYIPILLHPSCSIRTIIWHQTQLQ